MRSNSFQQWIQDHEWRNKNPMIAWFSCGSIWCMVNLEWQRPFWYSNEGNTKCDRLYSESANQLERLDRKIDRILCETLLSSKVFLKCYGGDNESNGHERSIPGEGKRASCLLQLFIEWRKIEDKDSCLDKKWVVPPSRKGGSIDTIMSRHFRLVSDNRNVTATLEL